MKTIYKIFKAILYVLGIISFVFGFYFIWDYYPVILWIVLSILLFFVGLVVLIILNPPKWYSFGHDTNEDGFYTWNDTPEHDEIYIHKNNCGGSIDYDTRS